MRRTLIATLALLPLAALSQAQLTMQVQQTIEGFTPSGGTMPVTAEFENDGPDARGVLRVMGRSFRTDYPIEIPRGGKKRLVVYPQSDYGEMNFVLLTNEGRISQTLSPEMKWQQGQQVLLVLTDTPGELAFVRKRTQSTDSQLSVQDAYCKPGKAPDRPVGYSGMGAVILGSGSERLSDREVAALKLWTLSGGTLVFVGGASAPILNDPRWADTLPASGFRASNVPRSSVLTALGGLTAPTEFAITTGRPSPAATVTMDGSNLLSAERQFGIGRVLYLAFNLFDPPLNRWEGRRAALLKVLRPAELAGRRLFVSAYSRDTLGGAPPPSIPSTPASSRSKQSDPFSTKLPPASEVFLVLVIYFITVVPVNFLLLKKLGRAELAWFTAPVLSLLFAGVLFTRAQDLYSAQMSSATQGILVAQEGIPEGIFIGASQVFIPRGGSYDLKLSNVDSVGMIESDDNYYSYSRRDRNSTVELDPIDDGEIHVSALRANNLAFKEINYRQTETGASEWFGIVPQGSGAFVLKNYGTYTLEDIVLFVGKRGYRVKGPLEPGQSRTVTPSEDTEAWDQPAGLGRIVTGKTLALTGKLSGLRPGPQLGKVVPARNNIRYAFISKEAAQ
jgi:hypothetical protein